ncbi:single-stranded DNA-binding protein [Helcococcus bovis]|uniref:single-stranded DNA-binding protein n=1 Tax=Helcococcus bovis TaxID=3153252 RepID=UPI0038BD7944
MNNTILMGRLSRDAELKYLQNNNMAVVRFNLAVNKNLSKEKKEELESKNQPTADFINCVAFGKIAETIAKYTQKGLRLLVNGRIQTGSYEKDGQKVYTTDVLVSSVEFIDFKGDKENENNTNINNKHNENFEIGNDFELVEDVRVPF